MEKAPKRKRTQEEVNEEALAIADQVVREAKPLLDRLAKL